MIPKDSIPLVCYLRSVGKTAGCAAGVRGGSVCGEVSSGGDDVLDRRVVAIWRVLWTATTLVLFEIWISRGQLMWRLLNVTSCCLVVVYRRFGRYHCSYHNNVKLVHFWWGQLEIQRLLLMGPSCFEPRPLRRLILTSVKDASSVSVTWYGVTDLN
jgi:hypothetical protein